MIVSDYRRWHKINDENGDYVGEGMGHQALYLYNYRVQEDGPRWMDSLDNAFYSYTYGDEYCQYAVLDTIKKTITYKRLGDDLKWIEKCDDVRAWGESVYCLLIDREYFDAYLFMDDNKIAVMDKEKYFLNRYSSVSFIGNYFNISQSLIKWENDSLMWLKNFSSNSVSFGNGKGDYIKY